MRAVIRAVARVGIPGEGPEALQRQFPYNSPWLIDVVEQAARLMGTAYHAHGLEANRHAVDTFCEGAFRDGLTRRRVTVDEFFGEFLKA